MLIDKSILIDILRVGHDTSMRGEGISLRTALERTNYINNRLQFGPNDLLPLIHETRSFVDEWISYSNDKRTAGGWYILHTGEMGTIKDPKLHLYFSSLEEAVAEYVVRELDFWAQVPRK